jgi:hypothetical protein
VIVVGSAQVAVAQAGRKLRDPGWRATVFDPNDPEKKRPMVTRAEREQLGLKAKSWDGVVHPEVYTTLHGLNETVERLKNTNTGEAIKTLFRVRFQGTVYVQVRLKIASQGDGNPPADPAALSEVQRRVLQSLTAAEFHVQQVFGGSSGLVGYVSREGLDKLANHPDVAGVCLDDQPLPEPPPVVYGDELPNPQSGEFADEPGLRARRVEAKVYQGLKQSDRLSVLVSLESKGEPLPTLTDVPGEMHQRGRALRAAERSLRDRVLSTLNADDFWLQTPLGSGFCGYINRQGLEKLWNHPEVRGIGVNQVERLDPREMRRGRKP